jgi:hypothetical protein
MNNTIEVKYDSDLIDRDDNVGKARFRTNIIILASKEKHNIPDTQIDRVFLHELLHFAFEEIKEDKLRDDEHLVDLLAGVLAQAFNTMEY